MKFNQRIKGFIDRNQNGIIKPLLLKYAGKMYEKPFLRLIIRSFFSKKIPKKWVFLVGCYNSGTTVTQRLLKSHPEISGLPVEGMLFTSHLPYPCEIGWKRLWIKCPEHLKMPESRQDEIVDEIIKDWSPWWQKGSKVFLEKSVSNVTRMKWLDDHFKNAYFIGITRDGYCVAEGIHRRGRPTGKARDIVGAEQYGIELTSEQWVDANKRLLQGGEQVERYHQISYEELAKDPVAVLNEIWHFLEIDNPGVSYDGEELHIAEHIVKFKNMNQKSIDNLSTEDIKQMTPILSEMQMKLGYGLIEHE